jgi:hypothetical protein
MSFGEKLPDRQLKHHSGNQLLAAGTCQEPCVSSPVGRESFGLELGLEHGVELIEGGLHVCGDASPLSVLRDEIAIRCRGAMAVAGRFRCWWTREESSNPELGALRAQEKSRRGPVE